VLSHHYEEGSCLQSSSFPKLQPEQEAAINHAFMMMMVSHCFASSALCSKETQIYSSLLSPHYHIPGRNVVMRNITEMRLKIELKVLVACFSFFLSFAFLSVVLFLMSLSATCFFLL
jgi:hypothetical protein